MSIQLPLPDDLDYSAAARWDFCARGTGISPHADLERRLRVIRGEWLADFGRVMSENTKEIAVQSRVPQWLAYEFPKWDDLLPAPPPSPHEHGVVHRALLDLQGDAKVRLGEIIWTLKYIVEMTFKMFERLVQLSKQEVLISDTQYNEITRFQVNSLRAEYKGITDNNNPFSLSGIERYLDQIMTLLNGKRGIIYCVDEFNKALDRVKYTGDEYDTDTDSIQDPLQLMQECMSKCAEFGKHIEERNATTIAEYLHTRKLVYGILSNEKALDLDTITKASDKLTKQLQQHNTNLNTIRDSINRIRLARENHFTRKRLQTEMVFIMTQFKTQHISKIRLL